MALSVCEDLAASPPGISAFARRACTKLPPIPAPVRKLVLCRNGPSGGSTSRQKEKEAAFNNPRGDRGRLVKLPPLSSAEKGLKNCLKIVSSWDWSGTHCRNWTFFSTGVLCVMLWCFSPSLTKCSGTIGQSRAKDTERCLMTRRSLAAVSSFSCFWCSRETRPRSLVHPNTCCFSLFQCPRSLGAERLAYQ